MNKKDLEQAEKDAKSVCVVVFNPCGGGSILAITRKNEYKNIGLPGGKIGDKERALEAATRECYEETGLLININKTIPILCAVARTKLCISYLSFEILGGKLLSSHNEGVPLWVHPHMLLKDECVYKKYNMKIYESLIKKKLL